MADTKSDVSRRKFISTSLGCLAGAGLAGMTPGLAMAQDEKKSQ